MSEIGRVIGTEKRPPTFRGGFPLFEPFGNRETIPLSVLDDRVTLLLQRHTVFALARGRDAVVRDQPIGGRKVAQTANYTTFVRPSLNSRMVRSILLQSQPAVVSVLRYHQLRHG